MRRKIDTSADDAPGTDSFLDIVANLVGILIILIMVIGVRAKGAWVESKNDVQQVLADREPLPDVSDVRKSHDNLHGIVQETEEQLARIEGIMVSRVNERDNLNMLVVAAERAVDEKQDELDAESQDRIQLKSRIRLASAKLQDLADRKRTLELADEPSIELEHLPSPMAKTVFGREEHFRLLGGRLVYVPLNALTDQLRPAARQSVSRLHEVPSVTETIGPIQGFHMQFTMRRRSIAQDTKYGSVLREVAELEKFVLISVSDDLGEPLDEALKDDSQFRQLLDTMSPNGTVVTVWTYPDSFAEFRKLKAWLYERGFATAARPLPTGQPIMGSPQGSRSAAQ
ncbi:MAG: hypothetical protein KDB27_15125 [Planctomycetales bacterium]|nr:hypothetical protein [Planctomycetales bacterium]